MGQNFFYMLNKVKFFATMVAFALATVMANAQEVKVDNLFSAPTEYVELGNYKLYKASLQQVNEWFENSSQTDSLFVLNKVIEGRDANKYFVIKYYWRNGQKKQEEYKKPFVWRRPKAVASAKGDTIIFGRRVYIKKSTEEMTLAEKEQVLAGEKRAFDPEHKNLLSWDRHKWGLAALGGVNFVESKFNPQVSLRWFYETCHLSYELEGTYSRASHTEESKAYGSSYNTFIGSANLVWKTIHLNPVKTNYIGFGVNAGYGLHKTDKDENAEFFSKNYGFTGGGFIRFAGSLSKNFGLLVECGYKVYPKVLHSGDGQEFSCNGPYINLGFNFGFGRNKVNNKISNHRLVHDYGYMLPNCVAGANSSLQYSMVKD
jgi:hypothetical protein